jgi:tetrahydrodipicolinate N-succinyltransferase
MRNSTTSTGGASVGTAVGSGAVVGSGALVGSSTVGIAVGSGAVVGCAQADNNSVKIKSDTIKAEVFFFIFLSFFY